MFKKIKKRVVKFFSKKNVPDLNPESNAHFEQYSEEVKAIRRTRYKASINNYLEFLTVKPTDLEALIVKKRRKTSKLLNKIKELRTAIEAGYDLKATISSAVFSMCVKNAPNTTTGEASTQKEKKVNKSRRKKPNDCQSMLEQSELYRWYMEYPLLKSKFCDHIMSAMEKADHLDITDEQIINKMNEITKFLDDNLLPLPPKPRVERTINEGKSTSNFGDSKSVLCEDDKHTLKLRAESSLSECQSDSSLDDVLPTLKEHEINLDELKAEYSWIEHESGSRVDDVLVMINEDAKNIQRSRAGSSWTECESTNTDIYSRTNETAIELEELSKERSNTFENNMPTSSRKESIIAKFLASQPSETIFEEVEKPNEQLDPFLKSLTGDKRKDSTQIFFDL